MGFLPFLFAFNQTGSVHVAHAVPYLMNSSLIEGIKLLIPSPHVV